MIIRRLGRDFAYTFLGLPLAVLGFGLTVPLFAAGLGTAVVGVGIPLLVLTLLVARGFADLERVRLAQLTGRATPRPLYAPAPEGAGWFRRLTAPLTQPQSWLDLLYAVLNLPIAILAFVLPVTWWAMALGGTTYWYWGRFLPRGENTDIFIETMMGADTAHNRTIFYTLVGVVALLTVSFVQRAGAALYAAFAQVLLTRVVVTQGALQYVTTTGAAAAPPPAATVRS